MNFFEHQDAARRRTGRLVVLFVVAVLAIMATVYLIVMTLLIAGASSDHRPFHPEMLWDPNVLLATAACVGGVIAVGSFYRIATLGVGGKALAETLGGRLLTTASNDWRERRLLNVVEEMALAAGTPVPAVYVMDAEEGINAFAAGFNTSDAVIGVTRGTMNLLTRDELQGVVAHEFSHIFNGDMRLNLRLVGVLHGILLLSLIGYFLMRVILEMRPGRGSSRRSGDKDGGAAALIVAAFLFGLALYVIGYLGVFFGKLIKSAVSRQREFLADASAVQFTRNPPGIGGALKKIGALGSRVTNSQAEQASHMFFGNAVGATFLNLLATHPPLLDRIRRVEPTFDGDFDRERLPWPTEAEEAAPLRAAAKPAGGPARIPVVGRLPAGLAATASFAAETALADVGHPQMKHLDFAAGLLAELPAELDAAIHDPRGAAAVVFALLLCADESSDEPALEYLARSRGIDVASTVRELVAMLEPLGPQVRLPIAQLTMSALRQLTPPEFEAFRATVVALVRADRRVSLFEFCLQRLIVKHLRDHFRSRPRAKLVRRHDVASVAQPVAVLLSALAYAGGHDDAAALKSLTAGLTRLPELSGARLLSRDAAGYAPLDEALGTLATATGQVKQVVLAACAATIGHDGRMTLDEAELLRTIADALDCPMPPPAAQLTAGTAV